MALTDEQVQRITDCLLDGRKIEAVKIYREATGEGLRESKEAIESLTASLRENHPDKFPAAKAGCGAMIVLGFLVTGLGGLLSAGLFA